jgi:hypothetical protein
LIILLITLVLIYGYIFNQGKAANTAANTDLIPATNIPDSFAYLGSHETPVSIGGSSINATESVYRNNGNDLYINVIENNNPQALLAQYKEQIQNEFKSKYNPFTPISLNGHDATQITYFNIVKGQQRPDYTVIWTTGKAMISVASPTANLQTVITLAKATGL